MSSDESDLNRPSDNEVKPDPAARPDPAEAGECGRDEAEKNEAPIPDEPKGADTAGKAAARLANGALSGQEAALAYGLPLVVCPLADCAGKREKKNWRKRHPFLFWVLIILSGLLLLNIFSGIFITLDRKGVFSGPRLGIVRIEGAIMDSSDAVNWIETLREDESVKGVLVRINSPGGAVVPSQEIYSAMLRLRDEKPVVVSMGTAAASGGYYVALGSHWIVASPATLTGSIGVRMSLTEMEKLMDTLGIKSQGLASGPLKEAGTPFRPMREDERAYLQSIIDDMYLGFVEEVASNRELELEDVLGLADGRAYTGRQALELGLVDELGDMNTALLALMGRCDMQEPPLEFLDGPPEKSSLLLDLLTGMVDIVENRVGHKASSLPVFTY